jgi:hypothetical protein
MNDLTKPIPVPDQEGRAWSADIAGQLFRAQRALTGDALNPYNMPHESVVLTRAGDTQAFLARLLPEDAEVLAIQLNVAAAQARTNRDRRLAEEAGVDEENLAARQVQLGNLSDFLDKPGGSS